MKASPPPDPAPGQPPAPPAAGPTPAAQTAVQPAPEPTPPEPPKPATWPEWFGAVDAALAVVVTAAAFLAGSFAAHNTDVWLHLANGRNLVQGKYTPGSDPYTFTGADRAWADTSWLFDLGLYAVYSADPTGAAVVAVKAVAFAAAFALLFLLRRPGRALWPWAVLAALGAISSAPYAPVRPVVASMLFLSATLLVLYRWPWRPGPWRQPGALAGLFWVWACTDGWFLLGPLTVALVLLGEWLHPLLTGEKGPQADDPLPPAPPVPLLARALVLGVVACLLNPMVLAAVAKGPGEALGQLIPPELGLGVPDGAAADRGELFILTYRPLLSDEFLWLLPNRPDEQLKFPGVVFAVFGLATLAVLAVNFARLRATHIVLWVAFAALAFSHVRLIPFFCLVATPLAAAHLNGLSARIRLGSWSDTPTRLTLTGSAMGRVLTVAAALLMVAAAYPGWLQNPVYDRDGVAFPNRVEWAVVPDAGLVRAAKALPAMRAAGGLPESVRGLNASGQLGDYCAWYAPGEKVFVNTRYAFHRPELADLLAVRLALNPYRSQFDARQELDEVGRVCDARAAGFVVLASRSQVENAVLFPFLQDEARWELWHLDGRSAAFGRVGAVDASAAARLRYDPTRLAFGPDQEPMPEGRAVPPLKPPESSWDALWDEYLARPAPLPPEADDAEVLAAYNAYLWLRANGKWQQLMRARLVGRRAVAGVAASLLQQERPEPPAEDAHLALPVLAVRLARRAAAAAPDRPAVYHALASAYQQPLAPVADVPLPMVEMGEQQIQVITALARFMARVPPPERCPAPLAKPAIQYGYRLNQAYQQTGQLDLARDTLDQVIRLAKALPPDELRAALSADAKADEQVKAWLKGLEDEEGRLSRAVQQHLTQVERQASVARKFQAAAQPWPPGQPLGRLPGKAIEIFKSVTDVKDLGGDPRKIILSMIVMELQAGRLEDAAADLAELDPQIKELEARQKNDEVATAFRVLQGVAARLEGNFAAAAAEAHNPIAPRTVDPKFARMAVDVPAEFARLGGSPRFTIALMAAIGSTAQLNDVWQEVRQALLEESAYQYDRAMLAINDANIPEARRRLEQALKPQGVDLARLDDPARLVRINRYLDLIRRSERPAK